MAGRPYTAPAPSSVRAAAPSAKDRGGTGNDDWDNWEGGTEVRAP